jgi:AcrR family transcriptional regulator
MCVWFFTFCVAQVNTLLYGISMNKRLNKTDWLTLGLKTLVASGAGDLKAEPMAKALNVSRGSFYWHFEDVDCFRREVLGLWRERSTDQVIEVVEQLDAKVDKLHVLLSRAFHAERGLERAVRAWAIQSEEVATAVAVVDRRRVSYIAKLLAEKGVPVELAASRACFVYWAYLGQLLVFDPDLASPAAIELNDVSDTLQRL